MTTVLSCYWTRCWRIGLFYQTIHSTIHVNIHAHNYSERSVRMIVWACWWSITTRTAKWKKLISIYTRWRRPHPAVSHSGCWSRFGNPTTISHHCHHPKAATTPSHIHQKSKQRAIITIPPHSQHPSTTLPACHLSFFSAYLRPLSPSFHHGSFPPQQPSLYHSQRHPTNSGTVLVLKQ